MTNERDYDIMISVTIVALGAHGTVAVLLPSIWRERRFFLPSSKRREVVRMYVTWEQLFQMLTLAFTILAFLNKNKKN